jgi:hypothetical protein
VSFTRSCSSCAATTEEEALVENLLLKADSSEEKDPWPELEEEEEEEQERWRAKLLSETVWFIASFRLIHVLSRIPTRHTAASRNVKSATSCTAIASSSWATAALCCMHDAGRCAPTTAIVVSGSERGMTSGGWSGHFRSRKIKDVPEPEEEGSRQLTARGYVTTSSCYSNS